MSERAEPWDRWRTPPWWRDAVGPRPLVMVTTSWPATPTSLAGTFVRTLARRLVAEGHALTVITPAGPDGRPAHRPGRSVEGGVEVVRVGYAGWTDGPFHRHGLPELMEAGALGAASTVAAASLALGLACAGRLAAAGPRAHAVGHWLVPGGALAQMAARVTGHDATTICHSGAVRLVHRLPRPVGRVLARLATGRHPTLVTCAELVPLLHDLRSPSHPTWLAPMPVEPPSLEAAPRPIGPPWRLVFMGRLVPVKGLDLLIAALAGQGGVELHVAGDGPERLTLERRARALGVSATFHGVVVGEDKARLLASAHGFVMPSRRLPNGRTEGVPVSLLEGLSYGLPALVTRVGGLVEAVEGCDAVLCEPDVEALRAGLSAWVRRLEARWSPS